LNLMGDLWTGSSEEHLIGKKPVEAARKEPHTARKKSYPAGKKNPTEAVGKKPHPTGKKKPVEAARKEPHTAGKKAGAACEAECRAVRPLTSMVRRAYRHHRSP
ncbi:hypothetical protein B296_00009149, partial [Ensete ventricosum]